MKLALRMIWLVLLSLAIFVAAFGTITYLRQDSMIFFPRTYADGEVSGFERAGGLQLDFTADAGQQTAFLLRGDPLTAEASIPEHYWLMFGGNAALALDWADLLELGRQSSVAFILIDYPGYGSCEGSPSRDSILANVDGAVEAAARTLGVEVGQIENNCSVLGHSLGAAVALTVAERYPVEHVILLSPFTSLGELAKRYVPAPMTAFLRHRFNNRIGLQHLAENSKAKVLIFHGTKDEIIPVSMSHELAAEYPDIVRFEEVDGAGHNDLFLPIRDRLLDELMRPGSTESQEKR